MTDRLHDLWRAWLEFVTRVGAAEATWGHGRISGGLRLDDAVVLVLAGALLIVICYYAVRGDWPSASGVSGAQTQTAQEPGSDAPRATETSRLAKFEERDGITAYLVVGTVLAVLLIGGLGGWAMVAELEGAVLASGTVVVDSKVKKVQHPTGGIVAEIRVKDGDKVNVGDLLMRLDETATQSNLNIITKQLDELQVREARLLAERDGLDSVAFVGSIGGRINDPEIARIVASERTLFDSRRRGLAGQKLQLGERLKQLKAEADGMTSQLDSKSIETGLMKKELDRLVTLEDANLVPATKMTSTRRDMARINAETAQLVSSVAQAKGKAAEVELQLLQADQDRLTEVMKDVRDVQGKEGELLERKIAAEDQLRRVEIRAPQSGTIHQLSVHTIGGVVSPAEPIMLIVPEGDPLVVEAKASPTDIDNVRTGQAAFVRFPAFNQRTTPEFFGKITTISADLTRDPLQPQGAPYYLLRITFADRELSKMGELKLLPGMPAEVHIETPKRTALSYLTKPLTDQIALAFRER